MTPRGSSGPSFGGAFHNVGFTLIEGLADYFGTTNLGDDPLFIDAAGPDGVPGTLDDNYRLQAMSPAVDAGDNNAANISESPVDVDNNPRIDGFGGFPIVDLGAYEIADCNENGIPDGVEVADGTADDCNGNGIPDACDPDCNGNGRPDDCDLALFPNLYDCNSDGAIDGCGIDIDELSDRIDDAEQMLSDLVPDIYAFTDGVNGTSISDGGRDMYDGGNRLSTNRRSDIPYSDSIVVRNDAIFGPGSAYMTKKINGIFMLFAEDMDITFFRTSGSLGADGAGSFDTDTFITGDGQFRAFVKRVYGTSDASVNHIMLIPAEITGATQTIDQTTNSDFHEISGIAGADRLIFIVTSRWNSTGLPLEIEDAKAARGRGHRVAGFAG